MGSDCGRVFCGSARRRLHLWFAAEAPRLASGILVLQERERRQPPLLGCREDEEVPDLG